MPVERKPFTFTKSIRREKAKFMRALGKVTPHRFSGDISSAPLDRFAIHLNLNETEKYSSDQLFSKKMLTCFSKASGA
jgi:hypothetical protein